MIDRPLPDRRAVCLCAVTRPGLVLGSTQPCDLASADIDVVRRRSGGGAVLVGPDELVWADVVVPANDELWDADVGRAFHWLGAAWVAALRALGIEASWHDGPMIRTEWSDRLCFAGVGPGEVLMGSRKVVGLSQRRTRAGALFQCAALLRWDPAALLELLVLDDDERRRGVADLADVAGALPVPAAALEQAFVGALPS